MLNIEPIKLLRGSHDDTGSTGQGCFMNVIAYLNGEPQITDKSECVCVIVRPTAIWLNDYLNDAERQRMAPFIMRAMGSASNDPKVLEARIHALMRMLARSEATAIELEKHFADLADLAARAARAALAALAALADLAARAARAARAALADLAARAAKVRNDLIESAFTFLDEALPPIQEPEAVHIQRAQRLIELATA